MKLSRLQSLLRHPRSLTQFRFICNKAISSSNVDDNEAETQFLYLLHNIVRGKQSWESAFNNPFITAELKPRHVEKVLVQMLDDFRLAFTFFNFLGAHKKFSHSTTSFCILIHALVQNSHFWAASSLLQTLLSLKTNPSGVFHELLGCYRKHGFTSSLGFDLMVQCLCEMSDIVRAQEVIAMVEKSGCNLNVISYNVLIHGLFNSNRARDAAEVKNSLAGKGLKADKVTYCTLVLGYCKIRDWDAALESMNEMLGLGFVPIKAALSVLVDGLRKKGDIIDVYDLVNRVKNLECYLTCLFTML